MSFPITRKLLELMSHELIYEIFKEKEEAMRKLWVLIDELQKENQELKDRIKELENDYTN